MEIGSAYRSITPRLKAVAERSTSTEFKNEVTQAIETFERVKSLDGISPSFLGLKTGDTCPGHEVMVSGQARLWDLGDRLHYRYEETTCSGLGETSSSYDYNEPEGKVYVTNHRDTQNSYLSVFSRPETERSYTLDLVTGTITDLTPWTAYSTDADRCFHLMPIKIDIFGAHRGDLNFSLNSLPVGV